MTILHFNTDQGQTTHAQLASSLDSMNAATGKAKGAVATLIGQGWQAPAAAAYDSEIAGWWQRNNNLLTDLRTLNQNLRREIDEWEQMAAVFGAGPGRLREGTYLSGLHIPAYKGDIPLPPVFLRLRENFLDPSDYLLTSDKLRTWVQQAAQYQHVPPELLAAILQQENAPEAPPVRRILQPAERFIGTAAGLVENVAEFDILGKKIDLVPDRIGDTSTGLANMKESTIKGAVEHSETVYNRPVLPPDVRDTAIPFVNRDSRLGGVDVQADIYYASAHLRELIDRVAGTGYDGPLTLEQVEKIAAAYNGSGEAAQKYGRDTVQRLEDAAAGKAPLYFFGGDTTSQWGT